MHVIAHSSTHAPSSASSRHCAAVSFGPARSSVACVSTHRCVARERLRDRVVLGRAHVTGREDRAVLAHQREHLVASRGAARRRRRSRRCPGPGMPSCAATPFSKSWRLLSVGSHTMRAPRPSATSTAAGFTPPTSRSQQMPPNTEIASPTSRCTAHASDAVGESCDFSTIARWPAAAASRAASNASTERARCGSGPKWQCRSAAPVRSTLIGDERSAASDYDLTPMSGLSRRSVPAPGQAPLVAPNAAALLRRNAERVRRPGRDQVRRPHVDARASTSRSRAGSRRCSSSGCPAAGPRHVAVLLDNTPDYLFAFGGAALIGAAIVGLNHTRRDEHLLRDVEHTHCGLVHHRAAPRGAARADRRPAAADPLVDPVRRRRTIRAPALGASLADALGRARRRGRSRARARRRLDLGADLHVGHVRRAEGGDLLAAPPARHRQAHVDDHGPRPRRRRLRVHAAVPLERGAGRLGAVDRDAVRGRPRPPVLRVAAGSPTSAATARPTSTTRASRSRTSSRSPSSADDADNPLRVAFGNEGSPEVVDSFSRRFGVEVIDAYGATEGGVAVNRDADMPAGALGHAPDHVQVVDDDGKEKARAELDDRGRVLQRGGVRRRDRQHAGRRPVRGLLQQRRRDREDDALRLVLVGRPRLQGRAAASCTSRAATPTGSGSTARTSRPARSRRRCARRPASCSPRSTASPTTRPATR